MKKAQSGVIVTFILGLCINAGAVSLTLEGAGTDVSVGNSQALYASDSTGRAVPVTAVGMPAPDGGKISELGVPSMMPDGRVVFGAEVTTKGERGSTDRQQWEIFIGNPETRCAASQFARRAARVIRGWRARGDEEQERGNRRVPSLHGCDHSTSRLALPVTMRITPRRQPRATQ